MMRAGLVAAVLMLLALVAYGYWGAVRPPVVVRYTIVAPGWEGPPLVIAQLSDTHAILPDMPPSRLAAIVARVNALRPDLVVLTGDYIADRRVRTGLVAVEAAVAPLGGLRAPLGVVAVLGNHDMNAPGLAERVTAALRAHDITVLRNASTRAGRLWIAGADDNWWGVTRVTEAFARIPPGAPALYLVHNPDAWVDAPSRALLTLAGHTHGGQIVLPWLGAPATATDAGGKWLHGLIEERGRRMIVSAGLGASFLPLRIGTRPEIVLVTLRGEG